MGFQRIELPGGLVSYFPGTPEQAEEEKRFLTARHTFSLKYMEEKGWGDDPAKLSIQQILEIRNQPGWKDPVY